MAADDSYPIFDDFAEDYERHARSNAYNALYDRPAVLEMLGEVDGQRVLDVGCGPGLHSEELLNLEAEVVALDHGERMVELAKARLGDRAEVRVHDLGDPLDWLESETFDAALMALVIHHIDDRVSALREVHRVLRPGGRLVISTHHPMVDWLRHGGSYFSVEPIEETWHRGWEVRYWRMPLTVIVDEFLDAGFMLDRLEEPLPAAAMATEYPEDYDKLNLRPGFINFLLRKDPC